MATKNLSIELANVKVDLDSITKGQVKSRHLNERDSLYWEGKGFFDVLMSAIDENLRVQSDNGRITESDYAQMYPQLVLGVLDKSIQLAISNAELKLKTIQMLEDEVLNKLKQENIRAQTKVYERQIEGFSDNLKLKLLEAQLSSFAMSFSSGMLDFDQNNSAFPKALKATSLSEVYDSLVASANKNWDSPTTKYSVEKRIKKGGEESGIEL
ncbi:hypothetical protein [Campylobacter curvus]|jgi:hypothetical protein|uniref:hypothetical protein n=1 Tax=Campylobacter curvus TaxID=200 RepID=UPI0014705A18|nr:hypothetical protein [Campylobacter curvus]